MDKASEQHLIKLCIDGDRAAQKKLFDTYSRVMYGICLRYSSNAEEAKDILQDGFVKVFTKLSQFGFNGSFEGWMKRVFVNTALEYYRVNKNHMYHSDIDLAVDKPHQDYTIERITQKEILKVMNNMAPGYRMVLNLFIIEGYGHSEIAEMMGISEGTSKSQLSRARVLLQQELRKFMNAKVEK